ncbi:MAG: molybdopterin-dependent oxidoreductase [Planctomycetota bacterium]
MPRRTVAQRFMLEHRELTRRYFLRLGAGGIGTAWMAGRVNAIETEPETEWSEVLENIEPFFTSQQDFRDVSRGNPVPHTLSEQKRREVGMTRETWKLQVVSDPDHPSDIRNPLSDENGTPFDFADLMRLAEKHAVRFPKVMTCLNIGCPLGMGIWEGVPLREVFWLTQPRKNIRRVFYEGYHNEDPEQLFQSSLPLDRILEDPFDLPPVILCYKLNGQWLTPERGGPVRVVVPEAYGFKSIKWLQRISITNLFHANDTYENGNNDVDSALKTWAATLSIPRSVKPGQPIPVTGYAQVGLSGLKKVQVWIENKDEPAAETGRYFANAPWQDAEILPPPKNWGGELDEAGIPDATIGFKEGKPISWPMPLSKAHWAKLLPGMPRGRYTFRCRTVDEKGHGQPMPRPFRKSGHAAIEEVSITVEG